MPVDLSKCESAPHQREKELKGWEDELYWPGYSEKHMEKVLGSHWNILLTLTLGNQGK